MRTARTVLAAAAAAALVVGSADAAVAGTPAGYRGGFVAHPEHLRQARMRFSVPTLRCAQSAPDGSVRIGVAGRETYRNPKTGRVQVLTWVAGVSARCLDGQARYRTLLVEGHEVEREPAHAGDRIRITLNHSGMMIWDVTAGFGTGQGRGPLRPRVALGAHVTGKVQRRVHVNVHATQVNHGPLGDVLHRRQVQQIDGQVVVRAGSLDDAGARFTLVAG